MTTEIINNRKTERVRQKNTFIFSLNNNFGWICTFVVFLIFTLSYFFLITPKYDEILELNKSDKNKLNVEYLRAKNRFNELRYLTGAYKEVDEEYKNNIAVMLPEESREDDLFSKIEYLVKTNGANPISISLENDNRKAEASRANAATGASVVIPETSSNVGKVKISLSLLVSDYDNFKNLLIAFENNLRIMDVVNIDFDPESNKASLILYTYYQNK